MTRRRLHRKSCACAQEQSGVIVCGLVIVTCGKSHDGPQVHLHNEAMNTSAPESRTMVRHLSH